MVDETYNTWFGKFYAIIVGGSGGMGGYLTFPVRTGMCGKAAAAENKVQTNQ